MNYILVGALAFLVAPLFELLSIRRVRWLKQLAGLASLGMIVCAIVMTAMSEPKLGLPSWAAIPGWVLVAVSAFLLVYSLVINLPWRKTYVGAGTGGALVKTGTYALVRHPGVLWFALLMVGVTLVSGARLMLAGGLVWLVADVIYVLVQDRYLFVKMFPGYEDYRRETPMLIPSRKSIGDCLRTIK